MNPQTAAIQAAVKQMVDAATAPIKQAQTTYDQSAQGQQQNVTGLSQALASILQGIGPGVQSTYNDASSRQAAFAKGFSDHMQAQLGQNASNTSSFLQNVVGAPTSQIQQVAGQVAPAAAGDTLYGVQGYIPASTLNEEGAAYTANAKQLPGIAASQGLQQIGKIQADQRAQDANFAQQIGTEAGKAPQYLRQLQNDAFDQNYKAQSLADNEAKTAASQKLAGAKFNLDQQVQQFNAKYKVQTLNLRGKALQLQANKFAAQTFNQDRNYKLAFGRLGIAQKSLQLKTIAAEYKLQNGGFSPTKIATYQGLLQQGIDAIRTRTDANGLVIQEVQNDKKKWVPITYGDFLKKSVEHGVPLSLAVQKANEHWPITQRGTAQFLSDLFGSAGAATAGAGLVTPGEYNQLVGAFSPQMQKVGPLIVRQAKALGLDPKAVLAVSQMEGAGGGIGDGGHAFGPFQLNDAGGVITGKFPGWTTQQIHRWAWSPAGINYALQGIAKVAKGLTGPAAVDAIVRRFERPLKPGPEAAGAIAQYGQQ